MDTDNKEDIESETEEDRAFIDRVLDREREEQSENDHECAYDKPEDNSPEPKNKKCTL